MGSSGVAGMIGVLPMGRRVTLGSLGYSLGVDEL